MGIRDSYKQGTFSWVDLATGDQAAAKEFYGSLLGWSWVDSPIDGNTYYSMARLDGRDVAAVYTMQPEMASQGVPPHWQSYITVDDVAAMAKRVVELGGVLHAEPFDVMDAGRMAVIADPSGAVVNLWQPLKNIGAGLVNVPGSLNWNELNTRDLAAAREFFAGLFGWQLDADESGYVSIRNDNDLNGGMHDITGKVPDQVPAHWNVYFAVADCDAATRLAESLGGHKLVGPLDIADIGRFAVLADPQGATFSVIQVDHPDP